MEDHISPYINAKGELGTHKFIPLVPRSEIFTELDRSKAPVFEAQKQGIVIILYNI
jgi:hypothetical protein